VCGRYVEVAHSEEGTEVMLSVRGKMLPAKVTIITPYNAVNFFINGIVGCQDPLLPH